MIDRFSAAAHERALQTLSTSDGAIAILAIDHRDSLRVELSPDNPDSVSAADITQFKIDVVRELAPYASAVMLESEFSLPQIIDADVLPGSVGFLAALEAQGYMSDPGAGPTTFLDDFGAEQAKRLGASAAKLLLHYNPAHREHADAQRRVVETAVEMCGAVDLPLLLEPMFYDLVDPDDQRLQVIAAARDLGGLGVDVLKMPFPIHPSIEDDKQWADACEELDEACAVPWALLSAGVGFGQYLAQLRTAVSGGVNQANSANWTGNNANVFRGAASDFDAAMAAAESATAETFALFETNIGQMSQALADYQQSFSTALTNAQASTTSMQNAVQQQRAQLDATMNTGLSVG